MNIPKITYNENSKINFGAIKSTKYLGGFAWDYTDSARTVVEAFESSEVLQRFCNNNDVDLSYIINPVGPYYKYASLRIEKIFPKTNDGGIINKFINLFRKKPEQVIFINAFDMGYKAVKEQLAKKISSIRYDYELKELYKQPYDEFNEFKVKRPKWAK